MKVDAEDFRRVYDSMNDQALLAVKRDELVAVAQQCYDAELAKRGLAEYQADADDAAAPSLEAAAATAPGPDEMVEMATFTNVDEARFALALLKDAGLPCYLGNADSGMGSSIGGPGFGDFRLSVPPAYLEQAQEILESEISEEDLAAQAEAAGIGEEEE